MIKSITGGVRAQRAPPFRFDMVGMGLVSLPTGLFKQLTSTHEANLAKNNFTVFPGDVAYLKSLKVLGLEDNQLTVIETEFIEVLGKMASNVEAIALNGNMLKILPPLLPLNHLRSVSLSSNSLTSLPQDIFMYVFHLQSD